ncbi:hypothetical protein B0H19DRAFT_1079976 [Mycena capillaripes]|nr:hypothetical protein B0H19DRAFT_1079976 [Mycena capillaripes]
MFGAVRFANCISSHRITAGQWRFKPTDIQQFTSILTFARSLSLYILYASILSGLSLRSTSWSQILERYVTLVLNAQTALYIYRDVYPLATYTKVPRDAEQGAPLWVKLAFLFLAAVIVLLTIPRIYIPVDPSVDLSTPLYLPR